MKEFEIFHPKTATEFRQRNELIAAEILGDDMAEVSNEYPLVLLEKYFANSFCIRKDNELAGHANLIVRKLHNEIEVGLIGNVVTANKYQGQGVASVLLNELINLSVQRNIKALFLWSELDLFYQKFGFTPVGKEVRLEIAMDQKMRPNATPLIQNGLNVAILSKEKINQDLCFELLSLQNDEVCTLKRTAEEFFVLLGIPETFLFVVQEYDKICGYFILGKGHDMRHVIHEWGGKMPTSQKLIEVLHQQYYAYNSVTILCPEFKKTELVDSLGKTDSECICNVGLGKILDANFQIPENFYLWGLDSI